MSREYYIDDEGDSFQLFFMEDGLCVGSGMFCDDGDGRAFDVAREVGQMWGVCVEAEVTS